jgi:hypothetical protein
MIDGECILLIIFAVVWLIFLACALKNFAKKD